MKRILYGPPNWIAHSFTSEQRRMFAFWTFVVAVILTPFFGKTVFFVTLLSLLALTSNFSAETPVEEE
jgi:Sec-independent protein secretion pathway component TatC